MTYGDKRDYKKIDIFLKENNKFVYCCTTTWAKTCKEAKRRFCGKYNQIKPEHVKANFQ